MKNLQAFLSGIGITALLFFVATSTTNASIVPIAAGSGDASQAPEHPPQPFPSPTSLPADDKDEDAQLNAFQESSTKNKIASHKNEPSRVTITVGEDNGFHYTVNGVTYSRERIALSGEYFNDEYNAYGYVRLFLVAEPSIVYYAVRPLDDRLDVYVQNYYYEEFYYEIFTPYPVSGYDLRHGQINSTAILVTGPSRSAVEGRRH